MGDPHDYSGLELNQIGSPTRISDFFEYTLWGLQLLSWYVPAVAPVLIRLGAKRAAKQWGSCAPFLRTRSLVLRSLASGIRPLASAVCAFVRLRGRLHCGGPPLRVCETWVQASAAVMIAADADFDGGGRWCTEWVRLPVVVILVASTPRPPEYPDHTATPTCIHRTLPAPRPANSTTPFDSYTRTRTLAPDPLYRRSTKAVICRPRAGIRGALELGAPHTIRVHNSSQPDHPCTARPATPMDPVQCLQYGAVGTPGARAIRARHRSEFTHPVECATAAAISAIAMCSVDCFRRGMLESPPVPRYGV